MKKILGALIFILSTSKLLSHAPVLGGEHACVGKFCHSHTEDDEEATQPQVGSYNVDLDTAITFASFKSSCDESCKFYSNQMSEKLKGVNNDGGISASDSSNKSSQE